MIKLLKRGLLALVIFLAAGFWALYFFPRPPLTTDATTLAGDGSTVDYCALPSLDGTGKKAIDIPKGNTPGCSYRHFPLPILAQCREPLVAGAVDIRGLWHGVEGRHIGHVERVEQCGARTVVTSAGVIHDYGPNKTGGLNTNDVGPPRLSFNLFGKRRCVRTSANMIWQDGKLNFRPFGLGPIVVRRYMQGDKLVWEYADGSTTKMARLCRLPDDQKVPFLHR